MWDPCNSSRVDQGRGEGGIQFNAKYYARIEIIERTPIFGK